VVDFRRLNPHHPRAIDDRRLSFRTSRISREAAKNAKKTIFNFAFFVASREAEMGHT
jgi:hypothetical protein